MQFFLECLLYCSGKLSVWGLFELTLRSSVETWPSLASKWHQPSATSKHSACSLCCMRRAVQTSDCTFLGERCISHSRSTVHTGTSPSMLFYTPSIMVVGRYPSGSRIFRFPQKQTFIFSPGGTSPSQGPVTLSGQRWDLAFIYPQDPAMTACRILCIP